MKKEKSHLETSMKKATIEMLLLKLLSEQDMYGYQLSQELKKRSSEQYTILEGSMYPILYRLTDNHQISFYEKKVGKRLTRLYYHLEPEGESYLQKQQELFAEQTALINFLLNSTEGDTYEKDNN